MAVGMGEGVVGDGAAGEAGAEAVEGAEVRVEGMVAVVATARPILAKVSWQPISGDELSPVYLLCDVNGF
eukprot:jgi/Tetstr1/439210/TSEL_027653.t1